MTLGTNGLQPAPISQPMAGDDKLPTKLWSNFFFNLQRLFSQPSYGKQKLSPSSAGFTGAVTMDGVLMTDREFAHLVLKIIPATTMVLAGASLTGIAPVPAFNTNVLVSLMNGNTQVTTYTTVLDVTGKISLHDQASTSNYLLVTGDWLRDF